MKTELKKRWLEALRSGEYKQGQRRLRNNSDEHCCLGVLCDLIDPGAWESGMEGYRWKEGHSGLIPDATLDRIGLRSSDQATCARLNDHGNSFDVIASWIEKYVETL